MSDNVVLLSDFQKVRLDSPILTKDGKTHEDTDEDGIYDCNELGDSKKVDITYFVWKTLYAELFGKEKATPEKISIVNSLIDQYKINVSDKNNNSRENNGYEYHFDWNGDMNPKRGLIVETYSYRSNPILKDTDFDGIDDGKGIEELARLEREKEQNAITYDMMKNDLRPLSNHFIGKMHSTRLSGDDGIEVDMTMDYRYFLMDNRNYYDELSTMSLLYANSIYQQGAGQDKHSGIEILDVNNKEIEKNLRVKDMMKFFGFRDVETYYLGEEGSEASDDSNYNRGYKDTHKSKVAIGYKNIEYHGIYKTVVGIVIRGTAEDDDWDSDFDMGDKELRDIILELPNVEAGHTNYGNKYNAISNKLKTGVLNYDKQYSEELLHFAGGYHDWTHKYHHAGFDIVANRIIEIIGEYMDKNHDMEGEVCYFVTGHSMGGGVANLVAASLVYGECGGNADNVYCYTFAAPNTFYRTDSHYERPSYAIPDQQVTGDYREPHGMKYRCIFNVVNEDDFVPEVPMKKCNWTKYGRTATISFNNNKYEIEKIVKNEDRYKAISYDRSVTKDYINNQYKGNTKTIKYIVDSFNSIFENDPENMRYSAYEFNDDDYIYLHFAPTVVEAPMPKNAKPYQKIDTSGEDIIEYQMPAYFMQYIAYAMHGGFPILIWDNTDISFATATFSKRYFNQRNIVKDKNSLIRFPHYLETYYLLTKRIRIIEFK